MWQETFESLFDVEDDVKYAQQYVEVSEPLFTSDGEENGRGEESRAREAQLRIQKYIVQRRDHSFFLSLRHIQLIPSLVGDLETYFALTCLGLAENLLHHVLLPVKYLLFGRKHFSTRDMVAMGIILWSLVVYWFFTFSTTHLYSYLYHAVRRASFVKLVIIFSMLDVLDKALSSVTQDSLEVLYAVVEEKLAERRRRRKEKERQHPKDTKKSEPPSPKVGPVAGKVTEDKSVISPSSRGNLQHYPTKSMAATTMTVETSHRKNLHGNSHNDSCRDHPSSPEPVTPNASQGKSKMEHTPAPQTLTESSSGRSPSSLILTPSLHRREESPFRTVDDPPVFSNTLLIGSCLGAMFSVALHSLTLLLIAVSLNVAINSDANSFLALLVSFNFNELKSTIFKKYSAESLHAVCVADAIERLQYVLLFSVVSMQYITEHFNIMIIVYALAILFVELFIDFSKILFCCKFNTIPLGVLRSYCQLSLLDIASEKVLWQLPEPASVRVVKPVESISLAAPSPPIGVLSPAHAKLLYPSLGFAPKNVRRTGFDVLAYASLLLWTMLRAGAQLFCAAPLVLFLCVLAVGLTKLCLSSLVTGLSARFVFRSLLETRSESAIVPHTVVSEASPSSCAPARLPGTLSLSPLLENTSIETVSAQPPSTLQEEGGSSLSSASSSPLTSPPLASIYRHVKSKEMEERPTKNVLHSSTPDFVLQLTPLLCALLIVDRFDLQAGKKK